MSLGNARDLTGKVFGRWTVLEYSGRRYVSRIPMWKCACECGASKVVSSANLEFGTSKSCGCLSAELTSDREKDHGRSGSRTHKIWTQLRQRCNNPKDDAYHRYGGRGIKVCERWSSFQNFLDDMGEAPEALTLDRIDNDGNYEPGNCRWATRKEQARNRTSNVNLTFEGKTLNLTAWSEVTGISQGTMTARLARGWSAERTLTEPVPNSKVTFDGETKTVTQWARDHGLDPSTLRARIREGWGMSRALSQPLRGGPKQEFLSSYLT